MCPIGFNVDCALLQNPGKTQAMETQWEQGEGEMKKTADPISVKVNHNPRYFPYSTSPWKEVQWSLEKLNLKVLENMSRHSKWQHLNY